MFVVVTNFRIAEKSLKIDPVFDCANVYLKSAAKNTAGLGSPR